MKTSLISKVASAGLLASVVLSGTAIAGPGPQYWQQMDKARAESAQAKSAPAAHLCPGAAVVPVSAMKPSWANGRGPLSETQIGTKTVCHMCPVTMRVTTNAWSNGRGPSARTESAQPGAEHDCSTSCAAVAMK